MEERRRYKRYSVYIPIEYQDVYIGRSHTSMTMNISEGGALIAVDRLIDIAVSLVVEFLLRHEDFFIRSRIVHIQPRQEKGPYHVGIEFLTRPESFVRRLCEELEIILLYQRQLCEDLRRDISLTEASIRWYRNSREWM